MAISFAKVHVLDPSRLARRLMWHVLSIGIVSRDEPEEHVGMDKAGLFLFQVKSGSGVLVLPHDRYELIRGASWWLLDLAQSRRYVPAAGAPLVTSGVRFSGPGIDIWRDEVFSGRAGFPSSDGQQSSRLRRAVAELTRLAVCPAVGAEWRMHEVVTGVLGVLLQEQVGLTVKPAEAPHPPVSRVVEAVQANPLRNWRAAELSALAGIGYSSLRQRFKSSQGETLHEYLQRIRLDQARGRLTDMRLTVKEIAQQLNFSSEFYFSRWFRQAAGMSPSRFRTMVRG